MCRLTIRDQRFGPYAPRHCRAGTSIGTCPGPAIVSTSLRSLELEEPEAIRKPHATTDLRSEVLDEREVIPVKAVTQVEAAYRKRVSVVLLSKCVRRIHIEHRVTGGASLRWKKFTLILRHYSLGIESEIFVSELETDAAAKRRNPRDWSVGIGQFSIDVVQLRK